MNEEGFSFHKNINFIDILYKEEIIKNIERNLLAKQILILLLYIMIVLALFYYDYII